MKAYEMKLKFSIIVFVSLVALAYGGEVPIVTYSTIIQKSNLVSISHWNAGKFNSFLCVLTVDKEDNGDRIPTRALKIYKEKEQGLIEVYSYQTPDSPISMYPLGEFGSRFFTAWTVGSSHHFTIFALFNDNIVKVLDFSSKLMPEFAWDKNGNEVILVSHLSWIADKKTGNQIQVPASSEIYKWNTDKYELVSKVPWEKRFDMIQTVAN